MKKTIKYLMLTLVAVFACVAISSCSKDDDDPVYHHYSVRF